MPRRKQQAPKRAAAYNSENSKELLIQTGSDLSVTKEKPPGEIELGDDVKDPVDEQDSPTQGTQDSRSSGHDVDSESHISESSNPNSDAESIPIKNKEEPTGESSEDSVGNTDSLGQMKAIYKSFLNNPYWSFLSLNSSQSYSDEQPASSNASSSSNSSPGRNCYDWHQSAIAKTLQQVSQKPTIALEPSIFSTVQLYRQSTKLYGSIFTGASKFHCKSCSAAYDTLLELTVHMNETDHYRDDNLERASKGAKSWSKPRKRSLLEMEGKEDAQKVLRCMYCGHSFESLQDLSVHMIKTKHYQKVPLREPRTAIAAKVVSSFRKRVPVELDVTKSLQTIEQTRSPSRGHVNDFFQMYSEQTNKYDLKDQNQKTSRSVLLKCQSYKCMECGVLHDSFQQLSDHMLLTGHFVKSSQLLQKTNKSPHSKSQSGKSQTETPCSSPLSPTGSLESLPIPSVAPEQDKKNAQEVTPQKDNDCKDSTNVKDVMQKFDTLATSDYLTEDDLKESPKLDFDILKSLENTVTSAINKAQRGAPSWGGYQSIHAAYQLRNHLKPALSNLGYISSLKQPTSCQEVQSIDKSLSIPPSTLPSTSSNSGNLHEVKGLDKKVTEKVAEVSSNGQGSPQQQLLHPKGKLQVSKSPSLEKTVTSMSNVTEDGADEREIRKHIQDFRAHPTSTSDLHDDTSQSAQLEPKQPSVSPLSALQSVMNLHLGKAAKPIRPVQDPMSMLLRMSNSMAERAALAGPSGHSTKPSQLHSNCHDICRDQPIDLSKGKSDQCLRAAALPGKALSSSVNDSTSSKIFTSVSPLHENALSDISDMLRNLSDPQVLKTPTLLCRPEQSEIEGSHTSDEAEDTSVVHKRKGRQSHWKPQHLLILQAQFTSCLRQTADGKYVISDLSSQERMVISHITGLSMTTISHWLANVKYQLRRTGRTKFIKNVDSGHPVFYCSECATQFQARATYVCHLESHLGFKMKDLAKLSSKDLNGRNTKHSKSTHVKPVLPVLTPARGCQEKLLPVPAL